MIGTTLSHFHITAKLGAGGMGEVYRAEDSKLGREVAIKVLPGEVAEDPERLERFQREARTIAALNHPNIVTLYSVEEADGVHFLAMELVEGRSLDELISLGGVSLERFFELAAPIADALATAHGRGIVHRDLKPANVMVTEEGERVKVLDFGLAKLTDAGVTDTMTEMPTEALTQEGLILGTPHYMSPEQAKGEPVDERSDIFSVGVLLYEVLTGERPFQGTSSIELLSSVLKDQPREVHEIRPGLPRHLGRVIARCLEKSPVDRYQTARDVYHELKTMEKESLSTGPAGVTPEEPVAALMEDEAERDSSPEPGAEKSIAVLPFLNRGGDPDDDYFSDGLSEELINALAKLPGIRVTARSSAFQFRGQELDVREVGNRLGVETVLEGSVRIAGDRLRITAGLIDCAEGHQLWSERFDGQMKDIFDTQDEITRAIVEQLEVELGGRAKGPFVAQVTENMEAYHLVLKARHHMADFWEPGLVQAIAYLNEAIALDPDYAPAHAELAFCYLLRSYFGTLPGGEAYPRIGASAIRALELDPNLAIAHTMHGFYLSWCKLDWEAGERELVRGIELEPQNVEGHLYYAIVLATLRRGEESIAAARTARELDPLNPIIHTNLALVLFYGGRLDEAELEASRAGELYPDFWFLPYVQALFAWAKRDSEAAISLINRAHEMTGRGVPYVACYYAAIHYFFDRPDEGDAAMAEIERLAESIYVSPTGLALIAIARGRTDEAVALLERARAENDSPFVWIRTVTERLDLITDERVREAMGRLGLP